MVAGESIRQNNGLFKLAALGANLPFVAAIGTPKAVLVEALLRLSAKDVQVAQVELKVAQVVGGDPHAHGNGFA